MLPTISDFLDERMGYKKRQILILQNIETFINDPAAVARLNKLAALVYEGLDTTVCIISPVVYIPREIEKYVTVVEMDYLTTNEIENIISSFADEWDCKVGDKQKRDLANALKGLTELEISNILSLAYSRDNDLKSSQKELIFEQKRQMKSKRPTKTGKRETSFLFMRRPALEKLIISSTSYSPILHLKESSFSTFQTDRPYGIR